MERLTREMTFEEEYTFLKKEVKELFDKEDRKSEPPESHCVVRRALRCIKKLFAELEPYKEYKDLEVLKDIKSDGFTDDLLNMGFTKGYNKAIDDFVKFASDMPTVEEEDGTIRPMWLEEIAEQLKAGD